MNIIDKIKSLFGGGKKEYKSPFIIRTRVHPLRLKAKHNDNVILEITVKNVTDEDQLTSVRIKTNKWVGTDITTLKKDKVIKLGTLKPEEEKTVECKIYSNSATPVGNHKVAVIVYSHFKDYDQIMNAVRKVIEIRAA